MLFGNWKMEDGAISWNGGGFFRFDIPKEEINETVQEREGIFYKWILVATNEDWITENDLYDLNYAFVYCIASQGLEFSYDIFDATLEQQFDQFESEDDEDF